MTSLTLEDAQAKLPELLGQLPRGEALLLTVGDESMVGIRTVTPEDVANDAQAEPEPGTDPIASSSQFGCYKLPGFWMCPDFNDTLDFDESIP